MKHIITALIQLQDLNFTLQEQKALTAETHLKSLEKNIAILARDLPADINKTFTGLLNHYATAAALYGSIQKWLPGCTFITLPSRPYKGYLTHG